MWVLLAAPYKRTCEKTCSVINQIFRDQVPLIGRSLEPTLRMLLISCEIIRGLEPNIVSSRQPRQHYNQLRTLVHSRYKVFKKFLLQFRLTKGNHS